jgi:hypothetical protein
LIPQDGKPKFIFAHIFAPHPPFVFGEQGEFVFPEREFSLSDGSQFFSVGSPEEYREGYRNQLLFLNQNIQRIIEKILTSSETPPIIILQGDHGPGLMMDHFEVDKTNLWERTGILNAYYFPGKDVSQLNSKISPVNTFRLLFNLYFGGNYPLLEDKSFYSASNTPYIHMDVTDRIPAR